MRNPAWPHAGPRSQSFPFFVKSADFAFFVLFFIREDQHVVFELDGKGSFCPEYALFAEKLIMLGVLVVFENRLAAIKTAAPKAGSGCILPDGGKVIFANDLYRSPVRRERSRWLRANAQRPANDQLPGPCKRILRLLRARTQNGDQ
jgi:hypothetical protein